MIDYTGHYELIYWILQNVKIASFADLKEINEANNLYWELMTEEQRTICLLRFLEGINAMGN